MSTTSSPPLLTPVDRLPGVGSPLARLLERLGLRTAADLLFNFPRRYEDYTELTELAHLEVGTTSSVVANIREVDQRVTVTGKHVQYVLLELNRHYLRAIWFNLPYMEKR
ncbi:MAG: ATP-dependent DNA helicase RecG, partial [Planctomycetota bacterium]